MRLLLRFLLLLLLGAMLWPTTCPAQDAQHFLMVNPGDEAATQERASAFLDRMARYLQDTAAPLQGTPVRGWITNRRDSVQAYLEREPALAFVPSSVYLEHLTDENRSATPILEIPRFGATVQRYVLVAPKNGPSTLEALRGGVVRAPKGVSRAYLSRVVFPSSFQPGADVQLEEAPNMNDAVFLMTEGPMDDEQSADALLLDADLKHFFETDDLVWPQLQVVWSSRALPRDLVVTLGASWDVSSREALRKALVQMPQHELGTEILDLMNSSGFVSVNEKRLSEVAHQYLSAE